MLASLPRNVHCRGSRVLSAGCHRDGLSPNRRCCTSTVIGSARRSAATPGWVTSMRLAQTSDWFRGRTTMPCPSMPSARARPAAGGCRRTAPVPPVSPPRPTGPACTHSAGACNTAHRAGRTFSREPSASMQRLRDSRVIMCADLTYHPASLQGGLQLDACRTLTSGLSACESTRNDQPRRQHAAGQCRNPRRRQHERC